VWQIVYNWAITKHLDAEEIWGYVWQTEQYVYNTERINVDTQIRIYILLTVHLGVILVNNQIDALFQCIYFTSLHVSSNRVLIIRRINCINT
jgi:hypothetical protein